ncbi:MAG: SPASM domain-containing protein, partial [Anaerolineaceae bacterium]|nr:SPASM domain-containing protein [Anaerolineaceae bacterium]
NRREVEAMKGFAESRGVGFRYDPLLVGGLDGNQELFAQRLSPEEVVQVDMSDPARREEWRDLLKQADARPADHTSLYLCGAGKNTFHIDPYGQLSPCLLSRSQSYDIRRNSFAHGWEMFQSKVVNQPAAENSRCVTCRLMDFCGQCPGKAVLEGGQMDQPIEYFCRVGHLRAAAFRITDN